MNTDHRDDHRGRPEAAGHPDDPRLRGHARSSCSARTPTPSLFAQWVGPDAMHTRIEHWDARTGGSWRYVAGRDGEEYGVPRLLPRGAAGPDRADLHLRGRCPTASRWRRCGSRTSATAAPGCTPSRWSTASRAATPGCAAAWRPASTRATPSCDADGRRWRCLTASRPSGTGRSPALFTDRVRGARRLGRAGTGRRLDRARRRAPSDRVVPRVPRRRRRRRAARAGRRSTRTRSPRGRSHCDAVQAVLDDPATADRVLTNPHIGELPLDRAIDQFYTADVFMHTWDLARATGQDDRLDPDFCAELLAGMEPIEERLRSSGQYGARGRRYPTTPTRRPGCWASSAGTRSGLPRVLACRAVRQLAAQAWAVCRTRPSLRGPTRSPRHHHHRGLRATGMAGPPVAAVADGLLLVGGGWLARTVATRPHPCDRNRIRADADGVTQVRVSRIDAGGRAFSPADAAIVVAMSRVRG